MKNKKLNYFLLVSFALLLCLTIYHGYTEKKYNYLSIISNALFLISMLVIVFNDKRKQ